MTDGDPPQPEAAEESALKPDPSQVASNTIMLPVPQPNTCKGNLGHGVGLGRLRGVSSPVPGMCEMVSCQRGASASGIWLVLPVWRSRVESVAEEMRLYVGEGEPRARV